MCAVTIVGTVLKVSNIKKRNNSNAFHFFFRSSFEWAVASNPSYYWIVSLPIMSKFSLEQLNYFKFAAVVLGEFPTALRKVFVHLWDTKVAPTPSFKAWDDSLLVRNLFLNKEGGKTKSVPTKKSYKEWDCTALFEATLYAQSFALPVPGGKGKTLADLYVKPYRLPSGAFHSSVTSPSGDNDETFALALDQLRLLRNSLCHNSNSEIVKKTFDQYIQLSKDAFAALGQSFTRIDDIGKLAEGDFPTTRVQQLEEELRLEKWRAIEDGIYHIEDQVKDVASGVANISIEVEDVKKEVSNVGSQVKDVKTEVLYTCTKVEKVESDVKNVKTGMEDVRTTVEDVGAQVKDVKTGLEDVTTSVKDVGSNVNEVKAGLINVNKNMDVIVTEVKTVLTDVRKEMDELKASVEDNKQANEAVSSKGRRKGV